MVSIKYNIFCFIKPKILIIVFLVILMDPAWLVNVMEVEEEERVYHLKLERAMLRDRSDPFNLPDNEFTRLFRLNKEMFQDLVDHLSPYMSTGERSTKIPINMRILATLRFFAQGSYQRCVGSNFYNAMGQQTFSETLSEVCRAFERIAPLWVRFPTTIEEQRNIKMGFMLNNGFPGVIGCIDGTHVAILCPAVDEHLYFNRKRYHSKNVQIICDRSLRILNVNANYPGATHDAFIWQNSNIHDWFQDEYYERNNQNSWLLGDSGYPVQPWLLTPVQGALPGTADARYNDAHSRARNCVERCIGK